MAWQVVFVPVVGTGVGTTDARRPKYFADGGLPTPVDWGGTDYGQEPSMLIAADLDVGTVAFLQAQADAFLIPEDLDALLTDPQVTAVQAKLEAIHVPAEWVTTALSWRTVIRTVLGVFRFMARFAVIFRASTGTNTPVFQGGVDLTRTFSSLSLAVRSAITDTANDFALDSSGITGASTLRAILKSVGTQMAALPLPLGKHVI